MTYIITGGAGFIGSHLVDALLSQGHTVIIIDDFSLGKKKNIQAHTGNKRLIVYRRNICQGIIDILIKHPAHALFHLAGKSNVQFSIEHPAQTHAINVEGSLQVLYACKKAGIKRVVFASSASVYGDQKTKTLSENISCHPLSPYALHKLIVEQYGKLFTSLYNLEVISLRYFNVFGLRQNHDGDYGFLIPTFIKLIRQGTPPTINGDGEQIRDFIYINDVVEATIRAALTKNRECIGNFFNIGSGKGTSVNTVSEEILKASGNAISPIHGPSVVEPRYSVANIEKAKKMLNWEPRVSFREGLAHTYHSFAQTP